MKYLIDTDVLIQLERTRAPKLIERFAHNEGTLLISSISISELYYGVARSRSPQQARLSLEALIANLKVLDFGVTDAEHAGEIRAELHRAGTPIGSHDMLIAGQARARGLILVTGNTRDFERVPGLRIENWLAI